MEVFREMCSKTLKIGQFEELEACIALILCCLETIFPSSFFDIVVHLPIHIAEEANLA